MNKLIISLLLLFQLNLQAQDDFSLDYNPFNHDSINTEGYYVPDDYYMDVPCLYKVFDTRTNNYIFLEGLVIYQNYYNLDCSSETYWDIYQFTNINYKPLDQEILYIFGFRIITYSN